MENIILKLKCFFKGHLIEINENGMVTDFGYLHCYRCSSHEYYNHKYFWFSLPTFKTFIKYRFKGMFIRCADCNKRVKFMGFWMNTDSCKDCLPF